MPNNKRRSFHSLKALMMEARLSNVPVTKINKPKIIIIAFLVATKTVMPLLFCELVTSSIRGGKTRASAVLLIAPTKEMNSPSCGIDSARMTERENIIVELRLHYTKAAHSSQKIGD